METRGASCIGHGERTRRGTIRDPGEARAILGRIAPEERLRLYAAEEAVAAGRPAEEMAYARAYVTLFLFAGAHGMTIRALRDALGGAGGDDDGRATSCV